MTIGPDFRSKTRLANKGIVVRRGAIGPDADYIASVDGEILRSVPLAPFTQSDE